MEFLYPHKKFNLKYQGQPHQQKNLKSTHIPPPCNRYTVISNDPPEKYENKKILPSIKISKELKIMENEPLKGIQRKIMKGKQLSIDFHRAYVYCL